MSVQQMMDFQERRMLWWEAKNNKNPLALGPLKTTQVLRGLVQSEFVAWCKNTFGKETWRQ
jgi:hypothetical protein